MDEQTQKRLPRAVMASMLAAILLTQLACIDLVGLRKFTDASVKAGAKFTELSADAYRSCAAEAYYTNYRIKEIDEIHVLEGPDSYFDSLPPDTKQACTDLKGDAANFAAANKMLVTYLYVMGQIAGDDVASTDAEFKSMKGALEKVPGGKDPIVGAALSIGNTITNIILDAKRRKAISKTVIDNNKDVSVVTDRLSFWIDTYVIMLGRERSSLSTMYKFGMAEHHRLIGGVTKNGAKTDPLVGILATRSLTSEMAAIDAKIKAANAYKDALDKIRLGHQELYDQAKSGLDKKTILAIAEKYAPAIQADYEALNKAF